METDVRRTGGRPPHREGEMSRTRRMVLAILAVAALSGAAQGCAEGSPTESTLSRGPDAPRDTTDHIPTDPPEMDP